MVSLPGRAECGNPPLQIGNQSTRRVVWQEPNYQRTDLSDSEEELSLQLFDICCIGWDIIGTVPTFEMHNVGTVSKFKMHNMGTPFILIIF